MISKEQMFSEFDIARQKDLTITTKDGSESYSNRIAYLKEHVIAKENHPNQYRHLDVNFKNLIKMYESGNPDEYNWKKLGIEPYYIKKMREEAEEKAERENAKDTNTFDSIN